MRRLLCAKSARRLVLKSILRLSHIHTFECPAPDGRWMRMTCYDAEFAGEMVPSSEIEEFRYLSSTDKHLTTQMGALLLDWFKEQDLID